MKKIAWITDTAAQLDEAFIQEYKVHVLPLSVVFADGTYRESIDLTQEEFYDKLRSAKVSPKTSQPAIGEMLALYEKLEAEGYDAAIALHLSKGLSGTFESAQSASKMTGLKVYPIDSKIGSFPMVKMIEAGNELLENGKEVEEVVAALEGMTAKVHLSFIPSSLNQLHKSGRVSGTQNFLSHLLNIKLVITFVDGITVMKEKVRSIKRAKNNVTDALRADMAAGTVTEVAAIHCNNAADAETWKKELLEEFPELKVEVVQLSVCVGVHAGEGTTGLSWLAK
ncbi:DegV family protein [Planomicrobium sp. MB-3u-38]|uniref:DegV family protein n=1 Tax=Planomicrobium sp. MB-3u-38 TaxID=2058318 RepID=UPI000C7B9A02|nr:DegV family protein [Planomicrobium sp. MB-3u-38]PKH11230.1 DegV family protein [Planomicrobium sp. MB-3u-38]